MPRFLGFARITHRGGAALRNAGRFFSPALFATDYTTMSSWKQEAQKSLAKSIELAKSIDKINETILDQCDQILEEIRIDKIGARRKHKPAPG